MRPQARPLSHQTPAIIWFVGAFHGRTMGALSLTASKPQQKRRFAPSSPASPTSPIPTPIAAAAAAPGGRSFGLACARYIEDKLFKTILPPEEVAAIFVEPIQGEGGYVVAPNNFLSELRNICDRHGILMVVDEVQSGGPHRQDGGPSSTPALSPTWSAWPRASPAACRSASA